LWSMTSHEIRHVGGRSRSVSKFRIQERRPQFWDYWQQPCARIAAKIYSRQPCQVNPPLNIETQAQW